MVRGVPGNPPDVNPFHHLWGWLKAGLYGMKLQNLHDPTAALSYMWNWVPHGMLSRLVASMERCLPVVVALWGGYTSR
jgi:hypothetical protein